jgi:hypothetical protein
MDGLMANGKTISPHFFGKRGDNEDKLNHYQHMITQEKLPPLTSSLPGIPSQT